MLTVTVYGLPNNICVKCRMVEISLRRKNVEFTKIRVDENKKAMNYIKSLGYAEAPVIVVTDDDNNIVNHWSGFSEQRMCELRELVAA